MTAIREEIVFAPSEDQRWMAGVLMQPNEEARRPVGVICIHGAAGCCYAPTYIYLGRALAAQSYLCLSGNTRAHDLASWNDPWPLRMSADSAAAARLGGTGWYRFAEVAHDLAGWIAYVAELGVEQVVLFGHSRGVLWVTYYHAQRQDPCVIGMILSSRDDRVQAHDPASVQLAEHLVAQGHGSAVLPLPEGPAGTEPPILESAESVVQWNQLISSFAADGHAPWIATIQVPILATYGTIEFAANLRASLEGMRARATQAPRFDLAGINGADHLYAGREPELASVILDWLNQVPAAPETA
jgi:pimeloyl-ACP methyl ester carboxylesterase